MREKLDVAWPSIMVIGAFVAGLLIGKFQFTQGWETGWEMVSGLGTVAAVFAAIWVAGNENRNRREEDLIKMRLVAARLYRPLIEASRQLGYISYVANKSDGSICESQPYQLWVEQLRLVNITVADSNENLIALAPLPNQAAHLLASAFGNISFAIKLIEDIEKSYEPGMRVSMRPIIVLKIAEVATEASEQLEQVAAECKKVIDQHH